MKHKRKRKLFSKFSAVFLAAITLLSMIPVISVNAASVPSEVKGKTISQVLGMNPQTYMDWLTSHENDNYYIGTPYKPYDRRNPNGDCKGAYGNADIAGTAGMNCTGFVWHVLYKATKSSGGNTSIIPALSGWYSFYTSNHISRKYFSSKSEMLKSGYLEKGDIIWMFNGSETSVSDYHHVGIYWGNDSKSDVLWHSIDSAGNKSGNIRTVITPKANNPLYVVIKMGVPYIKLQLQKSTNNNRAKYTDLSGAQYNIYTDSSCRKESYFGYIKTDKDGYGRYGSGSIINGKNQGANVPYQKYYCKEVIAPKGFALNNTVYEFKATSSTVDKAVVYRANTKDNPYVKLQLEKSSANPDLTDGNSCYSLKGAKYGIYTNSNCSNSSYYGYIETDEDGYGRFGTGTGTNTDGKISGRNIEMGYDVKFYAKEEVAPKGYKIDNTIYEFKDSGSVSSDGIRILRAYSMTNNSQPKDRPTNDPVNLMLQKKDAVTGVENPSLAGAEFEVKFYDGLYTEVSEVENLTPLRTWVFKTDDNGRIHYRKNYKVSGPELFTNSSGDPCLPVGTVTFKEIKAPTSGKYLINEDIFITTVTGSEDDVIVKNAIIVPEVEKSSGLTIKKTSSDGVVKGIWFRVTGDNGYSKDVEITNSSGVVTLSGLNIKKSDGSLIKYTITELGIKNSNGTYSIPKRYKYEGPKTVTLKAENNVLVSFKNTAITGKINIVKTSDDGKVDNIWFSVTSSTGKVYKNTTDTNGKVSFSNLPVYDEDDNVISYKVEELGVYTDVDGETVLMVPYKYVTPAPQTVTLVNNQNPTLGLVKTVNVHNELKTGSLQIIKESNDGIVTGMWFELTSNTGIDEKVQITDPSGKVTINDLPVYDDTAKFVQYTVTELGFYDETSDSYYLPSYYFTPSSESGLVVYRGTPTFPRQVTITNHRKYGNIKIVKTADDNYVEGLWFKVKSDNGYDVNIQTDSDGIAETGKVDIFTADGDWINYKITELGIKNSDGSYSIPERYETEDIPSVSFEECGKELVPNQTVTVQRNVNNKIKTANLEVKKTSEDGKVDNITFNVTGSNGVDYGNKTSDSNGTVLYMNLPVYDSNDSLIKYTVKELGERQSDGTYKIPYRYKTPKTVTKTLSYDSTTTAVTTVSIYNELKRGSVTLYKQDSNGKALTGSQWELYNASDDSLVSLVQAGNGQYQYSDTGKVVILDTDNNGRLKVSNLKRGSYYFVETKAPAGKMTYAGKIEFTISTDSAETLNLTRTAKDDAIVMYNTGGNGNYRFYFYGFTMLAISVAVIVIYTTRKKHGRL